MSIAYIMPSGRSDANLLLASVAQHLQMQGIQTCGAVQINTDNPTGGRCDMDVQILPNGPVIRISQSLGKDAKGCRLDSAALENAVGLVKTELDKGAQLLIINKFGKREAEGGGFRDIIAEAFSIGIPVLLGVNDLNKAAFLEFSGGLAVALPAEPSVLLGWIKDTLKMEQSAA